MPASQPTIRTAAAPAVTWRERVASAMKRRTSRKTVPSPSALAIPVRPMGETTERMELDQRVRHIGEW